MLPTKPDLHGPPTYPTECSAVQKLPNAFPVRIRGLPPTQHNRSNGESSVNRRPFLLSCRSNSKFPLPSGRLSATIPGSPSLRYWFPYQTQELIGNATGDNGNGASTKSAVYSKRIPISSSSIPTFRRSPSQFKNTLTFMPFSSSERPVSFPWVSAQTNRSPAAPQIPRQNHRLC